ncbi:MAG: hypothetical protein PVG71_11880, partial [Anaerolineae bacterium]
MKTGLWIGLGILVVVGLVLAALAVGWALWGQRLWAAGLPAYAAERNGAFTDGYCGGWGYGRGDGMMGRGDMVPEECPAWGDEAPGEGAASTGEVTIEEAHEAVEEYLAGRGYGGLEVAEVMEFERNFYAIAREPDTEIGAMELLVDKVSGAVGPEMGPNMMWNARYGMHRRGGMMGGGRETNTIPPEEALEIARRWLGANRPGVSPEEHVDPFYGYYTVHTLEDGDIEGMLSVHGTTGQVWYHAWHGPFIQMIED